MGVCVCVTGNFGVREYSAKCEGKVLMDILNWYTAPSEMKQKYLKQIALRSAPFFISLTLFNLFFSFFSDFSSKSPSPLTILSPLAISKVFAQEE